MGATLKTKSRKIKLLATEKFGDYRKQIAYDKIKQKHSF